MAGRKGYEKVLGVKFTIGEKTTTKKGKREYMREYMKLVRDQARKRRFSPRKPLPKSPLFGTSPSLSEQLQKIEKKRKKR